VLPGFIIQHRNTCTGTGLASRLLETKIEMFLVGSQMWKQADLGHFEIQSTGKPWA